MSGRNCDNCEAFLEDKDYVSYGSWSYTCPSCGFSYRHGLELLEQIYQFNKNPQPCGHPLSAIVTNGTTSYCGSCADDSLRANIAAGVEA